MPDILRFKGDMTNADRNQMISPDFGRRYLAIRATEYDPGTDVSTMTLRGILPDEFRERTMLLVSMERDRERLRKLFCG